MTMREAAARALEAADGAGLDRFVVCGLSMGGYVAFELWRSVPDRIAGLVLANTRAVADPPEGAEARRVLARPPPGRGQRARGRTAAAAGSAGARRAARRAPRLIAAQDPAAVAAASLGMAERPDSTADLAGIDVPTLVVTSDLDVLIPPEASVPMAEIIPGARLEVLEGVGHLSNVEAPDRFSSLLAAHCTTCGVTP